MARAPINSGAPVLSHSLSLISIIPHDILLRREEAKLRMNGDIRLILRLCKYAEVHGRNSLWGALLGTNEWQCEGGGGPRRN